jgi:hypothetical protein
MIALLLQFSAGTRRILAEYSTQTVYTAASVVLTGNDYIHCSAASGGAISMSNTAATLAMSDCRFTECQATGNDGGMLLSVKQVQLSSLTGVACSAGAEGAFHYIQIASTSTGFIEVNDTASSFGTAGSGNSWVVTCTTNTGTGPFIIHNMNQSFNHGLQYGSAVFVSRHAPMSLFFCTFDSNTNGNCIVLRETSDSNNAVSCVSFFNNTGTNAGSTYAGFLYVGAAYQLKNFLFQSNAFTMFLSGPSAFTTTFVGTVFDRQTFSLTNGCGMITSADCRVQLDGQATLDLVACELPAWRTPAVSASEPASPIDCTATPTACFTKVLLAGRRRGIMFTVLFTLWWPLGH